MIDLIRSFSVDDWREILGVDMTIATNNEMINSLDAFVSNNNEYPSTISIITKVIA